jgi:class 3 adenylate cyclase/TolB-like protein/cytochrome c-type biogenesis protein CcmH/NrfG
VEEHGPRRKLTTILSADCAGYSRLMRADEEGTYRVLQRCRQSIAELIGKHDGRIFGSAGDSVVAEFPSPVEAVRAAQEIQQALEMLESDLPADRRMEFRIGINIGDVLIEGDDLIGDGVNVAARLQGLAEPGGICVSGNVREQVGNKLTLDWTDLGDQTVKNIPQPIRAYRVRPGIRPAHRAARTRAKIGRRAVAAGILALLASGALAAWLGWSSRAPPRCAQASIAILPFANLSGDPAQDYLSDGTTEDIIAALGRFADLSVIAHVAVQKYKGRPVQLDELNRDLGVCYALEGSLRREGDQLLVTAQLMDALSGRLLWSDSYKGGLKDLSGVRNQITQGTVGKLAIKLEDIERRRALKKPTDSQDAYDYLLRGRAAYDRNTRAANSDARRLFERAIELDPDYASAYAALGQTRLAAAVSGWTEFRSEALEQAGSLAQKAIDLDADNAEAHRLLGSVYFNRGQFDLALAEQDRAIELNPSDAASYDERGTVLVFMGRPADALESLDNAARLNPEASWVRLEMLGWAYYLERRYEDAIRAWTEGVRLNPDDSYMYSGLAAAYAQLGRKDEASRAAADLKRVWPFFTVEGLVVQFRGDADRALIAEGLHKAGLT